MQPRLMVCTAALAGLLACSDDNNPSTIDGGIHIDGAVTTPDAGSGDAPSIDNLPVNETVTMSGLTAPVDVVRDTRGAPHIYGKTIPDVLRVQGYLMARDRFPQMEFIRRAILGRLSEVGGDLGLGLIAMDQSARVAGFGREGKAIYDSIDDNDESKIAANAFVAGVNQYIAEVKAATDKTPYIPVDASLVLNLLYGSAAFGPWDPSDIFALGRFQSTSLSFDTDDITFTQALAGVQAKFGKVPADDRRAGAFVDLYTMLPARATFTRDGLGTAAKKRTAKAAPTQLPSLKSLQKGREFFAGQKRILDLLGDSFKGSNNWMVSGDHTASGAPILANDPHLSLTSPSVWWYSHLNTKRGGGDLNAMGVSFAGIPGVVLGFNEDIAWGATVTNYDVTDVYNETVTGDSVLFNGNQVPLQTVTETIDTNGGNTTVTLQKTPRGGYIIPGTTDNGHALSLRYTGYEPSNELAYFYGLLRAHNVAEARAAQLNFKVGSQNFIVAAKDGDISWSTISRVPIRDPRAFDLTISADGVVDGNCPIFVLPGTGEFEWTGDIDPQMLPSDKNPAKGFIATANNDPVGVTADGNPCNDAMFLGGRYDLGWREFRIAGDLTALIERGNITADDISGVQAEHKSSLGEKLRDPMVTTLAAVIAASDGTFTADELTKLGDVHDRLMAWSLATPHGIGATAAAEVSDSVATAIFNVGLMYIIPAAFGDEVTQIGVTPGGQEIAALLERAMTNPSMLATFDPDINDTVLWDDLTTDAVETKDVIVARGFLSALAFLESKLGADETGWRWGMMHTVIFKSVLPVITPPDHLSIPASDDPVNGNGFPRHSDCFAVDVGDWSLWSAMAPRTLDLADFRQTSGPSQRLVVELLPTGPQAHNALPGGQVFDPASPHHADEAQLWIANQAPALFFTEADVVKHAEAHLRFTAP